MQTLVLYQYVHCPFCVRVRMAAGLLGQQYRSVVLPYDDEVTPQKLTGKKMLPIMSFNGVPINESLDIIAKFDSANRLKVKEQTSHPEWHNFLQEVEDLGSLVHSLAMPYWIWTPEFTPSARDYFVKKKEMKRGPFPQLVQRRSEFEMPLMQKLSRLEERLTPFYHGVHISIKDIVLAAQLWGLYVVPEFRFSQKWHDYMQLVKKTCAFSYHKDFWS